jgi:hypothetical protein
MRRDRGACRGEENIQHLNRLRQQTDEMIRVDLSPNQPKSVSKVRESLGSYDNKIMNTSSFAFSFYLGVKGGEGE